MSANAFLTYDTVGNRENLLDIVTDISPLETPMLSSFKKVDASARKVEWMTYALTAAASNKAVEGADFSFSKPTDRTRVENYTQIFTKTFEVSGTQEVVDKAGVDSEYAFRLQNALKELARDMEYAIVNNTGTSGASGTARELTGVLAWLTTNVETGSGTRTEALTETMYNDLLQTVYAAGGNPDTTYANGWQKRKISGFSANNTRNVDASGNRLVNAVDVYESDFGIQKIVLDRYMPTDVVACLQNDMWAVATLRPVKAEEVAKVGDAMRGAVVGENTIVSYNEKASGKITGLTTA